MSHNVSFQVKNSTGAVISNVSVIHTCNDQSIGIQVDSMNPDNTFPNPSKQFTTYNGHKDYYRLQFIMNGNSFAGDCYCSADNDDNAVTIELCDGHYNVLYNTSDCTNKSYND